MSVKAGMTLARGVLSTTKIVMTVSACIPKMRLTPVANFVT